MSARPWMAGSRGRRCSLAGGADPALPVGGSLMSEPQDAASESTQRALEGDGVAVPAERQNALVSDAFVQRQRLGLRGAGFQPEGVIPGLAGRRFEGSQDPHG